MENNVKISVKNLIIKHVEKGNINKNVENPVCAFTVEKDNQDIKLLLKGDLAKIIYETYLSECKTRKDTYVLGDKIYIKKEVTVSFDAYFKCQKYKQIVCNDPSYIEFNFNYGISQNA